jgi:hypothetical protein
VIAILERNLDIISRFTQDEYVIIVYFIVDAKVSGVPRLSKDHARLGELDVHDQTFAFQFSGFITDIMPFADERVALSASREDPGLDYDQ